MTSWLRNDALDALQRRHAVEARQAWQKLVDDFPDNETLVGLSTLIGVLEGDSATPLADHRALATVCCHLGDAVEPAARRLMGDAAGRAWMASCWRAVAQQAAALPFRVEERDHHAAPLWLRAGDWEEARRAVERIESWRRIPAPLAWMAEARYRADGLECALPLLTELAWLSPGLLAGLLHRLNDASIDGLRKKFDANFDGAGQVSDLVSSGSRAVLAVPHAQRAFRPYVAKTFLHPRPVDVPGRTGHPARKSFDPSISVRKRRV